MSWNNRRVLITGGLGFIGSNLARRLVSEGAQVTLVDSLIPEYGGNLFNISDFSDRVSVNISDVRDEFSMAHLIKGKEFLFNLAGQTSHMDSMRHPKTDLEINCSAQLSILESCRKQNPDITVVYGSTRQIYGRPKYLPVDELHPIRPVDVNGINKLAGEGYHLLYHDVYGIPATVLRLTNTIGPGMRVKDARQTFVGTWLRCALDGAPFEVWGGEQKRDFNYVDDVVEAMLSAAIDDQSIGRIFNLGGSEPLSLLQLAEKITEIVPKAAFKTMDYPPERKKIDIGDYYSDWTLIQEKLGWTPRVGIDDALIRTISFLRKHLPEYTK